MKDEEVSYSEGLILIDSHIFIPRQTS